MNNIYVIYTCNIINILSLSNRTRVEHELKSNILKIRFKSIRIVGQKNIVQAHVQ